MKKHPEITSLTLRRPVSVVELARGRADARSSLLGAAFSEMSSSWQSTDEGVRLSYTTRYGTTTLLVSHSPALCAHCGDPVPCCEKVGHD